MIDLRHGQFLAHDGAVQAQNNAAFGRRRWGSYVIGKNSTTSILPHACSLRALGTLGDLKLHSITFVERLEAFALNVAVMYEDIRTVIGRDETVPFSCVEPFYCPGCHSGTPSDESALLDLRQIRRASVGTSLGGEDPKTRSSHKN